MKLFILVTVLLLLSFRISFANDNGEGSNNIQGDLLDSAEDKVLNNTKDTSETASEVANEGIISPLESQNDVLPSTNGEEENNTESAKDSIPVVIGEDAVNSNESGVISDNATLATAVAFNITKINCSSDKTFGPVELVNATRLMELLIEPVSTNKTSKNSKEVPGTCMMILFYARWCVFSSQAAPHFNALARFFPHLKTIAIDAIQYQNFNTQYGIVGVPTLVLLHNGKPAMKFNLTVYTLESFSRFLTLYTNLKQEGLLHVTSADFSGPVPSTPSLETDYCLVLSWFFIAICALYFISKSRLWRQFVELIQNTWRESNAQHEHVD